MARRAAEYNEIKDCTFVPSTLPGAPELKPVEIRGLDRHLELKELQKRKEEELALREAEVFGLNCKFEGNTVPEPFEFNTEARSDKN